MAHLQYFNYPGFGERVNKEVHYSSAVKVDNRIEISGQGGWDQFADPLDIPKDAGAEIDRAFDNVRIALENAGGKGWSQVYKVRIYLVAPWDASGGHITRNLRKWCPDHAPLLTVIGVPQLALEDMKIEIEVAAHLG